ncbi:MAG: hypothetical protein JRH20_00965 [Deltaproteobacteria bacterium]|nr:hypothetical protein [Deltaproteobacteria bacterium]
MACRHLRFVIPEDRGDEWVPMALREAKCALRGSNPEKWNEVLRCHSVPVEGDDTACMHNLDGTWKRCPLSVERTPRKEREAILVEEEGQEDDDVPRNEHGYPLVL